MARDGSRQSEYPARAGKASRHVTMDSSASRCIGRQATPITTRAGIQITSLPSDNRTNTRRSLGDTRAVRHSIRVPGPLVLQLCCGMEHTSLSLRPLERAIRLSTGHAFTFCFGYCRSMPDCIYEGRSSVELPVFEFPLFCREQSPAFLYKISHFHARLRVPVLDARSSRISLRENPGLGAFTNARRSTAASSNSCSRWGPRWRSQQSFLLVKPRFPGNPGALRKLTSCQSSMSPA